MWNSSTYLTHGIFLYNFSISSNCCHLHKNLFCVNHQTISVAHKISRIIGFHENQRKYNVLRSLTKMSHIMYLLMKIFAFFVQTLRKKSEFSDWWEFVSPIISHVKKNTNPWLLLFSCPAVNITMLTVVLYWLSSYRLNSACSFLSVSSCPGCPSESHPMCPFLSVLLCYSYIGACCPPVQTVLPIGCPMCIFLAVLLHFQELTAIFSLLSFLLTVMYVLFGCPASFPWTYCPLFQTVLPIGCPMCIFLAVLLHFPELTVLLSSLSFL
jgi:hypothetical protein